MANKFFELAKKETTLSDIMNGREKTTCQDLIAKYPEGITLTEFDIVSLFDKKKGGESPVPVFAIAEDSAVFFFGGAVLLRIASQWSNAFNGDIAKASEELSTAGGVKIRMKHKITKGGNNLIAVEVVG